VLAFARLLYKRDCHLVYASGHSKLNMDGHYNQIYQFGASKLKFTYFWMSFSLYITPNVDHSCF